MSRGAMPALWHARRIGTGTVMIPPVSRTWQMCDPPASNVTADTLARLLGPLDDCDRKRVTVLFHILPPDRTAFLAEQNRQRAANQVSQEKRASVSARTRLARRTVRP